MTVVQESTANTASIHDAARKLADYNMEVPPDPAGIYQFPAVDIIRLVLLDPVTIPSEEMVPYSFNVFPQGGAPYPSAIVVIRPEEKAVLPQARLIEDLAPSIANDGPNPEYPWQVPGGVVTPADHEFFNLQSDGHGMVNMLKFLDRCFQII